MGKKKVFVRKPYDSYLYKWSPADFVKTNPKIPPKNGNGPVEYCNAIPFSQGEDFITTYCYETVVVNGVVKRLAYVACDYVE